MAVVGVDSCKRGWIAVVVRPHSVRGVFAETLDRLADKIPDAEAFAIDIPIGLRSVGRRRADVEARRFVGARRSPGLLVVASRTGIGWNVRALRSSLNADMKSLLA